MIMPFGKHKGKPLDAIPLDYLAWVLRDCANVSPLLRDEIRRILLAEVERQADIEARQTPLALPSVVDRWYRQLAREFHPDVGGSHDAMKAVNRGRDLLLELAEVA